MQRTRHIDACLSRLELWTFSFYPTTLGRSRSKAVAIRTIMCTHAGTWNPSSAANRQQTTLIHWGDGKSPIYTGPLEVMVTRLSTQGQSAELTHPDRRPEEWRPQILGFALSLRWHLRASLSFPLPESVALHTATETVPCSEHNTGTATETVPCSDHNTDTAIETVPCSEHNTDTATETVPCSEHNTDTATDTAPCSENNKDTARHRIL
jgi:hypothetical protein